MQGASDSDECRTEAEVAVHYSLLFEQAAALTHLDGLYLRSLLDTVAWDVDALTAAWERPVARAELLASAGLRPHSLANDQAAAAVAVEHCKEGMDSCAICLEQLPQAAPKPPKSKGKARARGSRGVEAADVVSFACGHRLHIGCFGSMAASHLRDRKPGPIRCVYRHPGQQGRKCNGLLQPGDPGVKAWLASLPDDCVQIREDTIISGSGSSSTASGNGGGGGGGSGSGSASIESANANRSSSGAGKAGGFSLRSAWDEMQSAAAAPRDHNAFTPCPRCPLHVRPGRSNPAPLSITCRCGLTFCRRCRGAPHEPVPCVEALQWREGVKTVVEVLGDDSEGAFRPEDDGQDAVVRLQLPNARDGGLVQEMRRLGGDEVVRIICMVWDVGTPQQEQQQEQRQQQQRRQHLPRHQQLDRHAGVVVRAPAVAPGFWPQAGRHAPERPPQRLAPAVYGVDYDYVNAAARDYVNGIRVEGNWMNDDDDEMGDEAGEGYNYDYMGWPPPPQAQDGAGGQVPLPARPLLPPRWAPALPPGQWELRLFEPGGRLSAERADRSARQLPASAPTVAGVRAVLQRSARVLGEELLRESGLPMPEVGEAAAANAARAETAALVAGASAAGLRVSADAATPVAGAAETTKDDADGAAAAGGGANSSGGADGTSGGGGGGGASGGSSGGGGGSSSSAASAPVGDEALAEAHMAATSKPCPKCFVPITREAGCNAMACTNCHQRFCWHCLEPEHTHGQCMRTVDFAALRARAAQLGDGAAQEEACRRVENLNQYDPAFFDRQRAAQHQPQLVGLGLLAYRRLCGKWLEPLLEAHAAVQALLDDLSGSGGGSGGGGAMAAGAAMPNGEERNLVVLRLHFMLEEVNERSARWEAFARRLAGEMHRAWNRFGPNLPPGQDRWDLLAEAVSPNLSIAGLDREARQVVTRRQHVLNAAISAWVEQLLPNGNNNGYKGSSSSSRRSPGSGEQGVDAPDGAAGAAGAAAAGAAGGRIAGVTVAAAAAAAAAAGSRVFASLTGCFGGAPFAPGVLRRSDSRGPGGGYVLPTQPRWGGMPNNAALAPAGGAAAALVPARPVASAVWCFERFRDLQTVLDACEAIGKRISAGKPKLAVIENRFAQEGRFDAALAARYGAALLRRHVPPATAAAAAAAPVENPSAAQQQAIYAPTSYSAWRHAAGREREQSLIDAMMAEAAGGWAMQGPSVGPRYWGRNEPPPRPIVQPLRADSPEGGDEVAAACPAPSFEAMAAAVGLSGSGSANAPGFDAGTASAAAAEVAADAAVAAATDAAEAAANAAVTAADFAEVADAATAAANAVDNAVAAVAAAAAADDDHANAARAAGTLKRPLEPSASAENQQGGGWGPRFRPFPFLLATWLGSQTKSAEPKASKKETPTAASAPLANSKAQDAPPDLMRDATPEQQAAAAAAAAPTVKPAASSTPAAAAAAASDALDAMVQATDDATAAAAAAAAAPQHSYRSRRPTPGPEGPPLSISPELIDAMDEEAFPWASMGEAAEYLRSKWSNGRSSSDGNGGGSGGGGGSAAGGPLSPLSAQLARAAMAKVQAEVHLAVDTLRRGVSTLQALAVDEFYVSCGRLAPLRDSSGDKLPQLLQDVAGMNTPHLLTYLTLDLQTAVAWLFAALRSAEADAARRDLGSDCVPTNAVLERLRTQRNLLATRLRTLTDDLLGRVAAVKGGLEERRRQAASDAAAAAELEEELAAAHVRKKEQEGLAAVAAARSAVRSVLSFGVPPEMAPYPAAYWPPAARPPRFPSPDAAASCMEGDY